MPRWTQSEFDDYQRQTGHRHPVDRPRPGVQEPEDHSGQTIDNGPEGKKVDGASDRQHSLTVEILMSDRRRRDLDGGLATICDCIVAARRQLESAAEDKGDGKGGTKG